QGAEPGEEKKIRLWMGGSHGHYWRAPRVGETVHVGAKRGPARVECVAASDQLLRSGFEREPRNAPGLRRPCPEDQVFGAAMREYVLVSHAKPGAEGHPFQVCRR